MKKLEVLMLCVWMLWGMTAFGQTAKNQVGVDTTIGVGGNAFNDSPVISTSQAQGGAGGSSQSNAGITSSGNGMSTSSLSFNYAPVTYSSYPDPRAGIVNPQIPGSPWWQPNENQIALWNDWSSPLGAYERVYTMKECKTILKDMGWEDFGYTCSKSFVRKHPPTSQITVRWLQMVVKREQLPDPNSKDGKGVIIRETSIGIPPENLPGKLWMGGVTGKGSKNKVKDALLAKLLKLAMESGGSYAVISYSGMNIHYMGQSLAPGSGMAGAGVQNSFSFIGGASFTKAGANGDSVLRMAIYEADGEDAKKLETPSREEEVQPQKESDGREPDEAGGNKVNPEMLKSSSDEDRVLYYWGGVKTSKEAQEKAQISRENIAKISPRAGK